MRQHYFDHIIVDLKIALFQQFLKPFCQYYPLVYDILLLDNDFNVKSYHLSQKSEKIGQHWCYPKFLIANINEFLRYYYSEKKHESLQK